MAEGEGVLGRWSRLKQEARLREPEPAASEPPASETLGEPVEEAGPDEIPEGLPDIESLDENSDFSPFLSGDVPEALQRLALRKLWRLDPVLANLDGLVDYGEDFTDAATVIEGMRTAYKVGKGIVDDDEEVPESLPEDEDPALASLSNTDESSSQAPEEPVEEAVVSSGLSEEGEPV